MDDVDDTDTPLVGRTLPFWDEKLAAGLGWAAAPLADTGVLLPMMPLIHVGGGGGTTG